MGIFNTSGKKDRKHGAPSSSPKTEMPPPPYPAMQPHESRQESATPPLVPYGSTHSDIFSTIQLSRTDLIRIMGFPKSMLQPMDDVIRRTWTLGVQDSGPVDEISYEWKLSGNPCMRCHGRPLMSRDRAWSTIDFISTTRHRDAKGVIESWMAPLLRGRPLQEASRQRYVVLQAWSCCFEGVLCNGIRG